VPGDALLTPENAIAFLNQAARYFRKRDTHGEDIGHWSNVYNAENCEKIAKLIADLTR
jgi:hypothetical protein